MLNISEHLSVLLGIQLGENVVILLKVQNLFFYASLIALKFKKLYLLQNCDGHVEMMMLHCRCGVDCGQRRANINHEFVIESTVIQIMANGSNIHGQALEI